MYNLAIPFLDVYPRELKTYIHTKIVRWMLIIALFTTVNDRNNSNIHQIMNGYTKWDISIHRILLRLKSK